MLIVNEKLKDYSSRLISEEVQIVGRGAFSHVFEHPLFPDVAVKLVTRRDHSYRQYLRWTMRHQSNVFVPKILDIVECKAPGECYSIVFIEKLENIRTDRTYISTIRKALGCLTAAEAARMSTYLCDPTFYRFFRFFNKIVTSDRCTNEDLKQVWRFISGYGHGKFDLHRGNIMLRGKQMVFSDPLGRAPADHLRFDNG